MASACCSDNEPAFTEEYLKNIVPYYTKLMPLPKLYEWFGYGNPEIFAKREISFTLSNDVYIRYQSFDSFEEFFNEIKKKAPVKIDIGAIYKTKPKIKALGFELTATRKDLVFDIDISDYDDVRTCCNGAGICNKCWKFMAIATKIISAVLKEDFNYEHILWVFSGRRGIHCWVADRHARELTNEVRSAMTEYFNLLKDGNKTKKVVLTGRIHKKIYERAIKIIDEYFMDILEEQDLLGTDLRLRKFLDMIDKGVRKQFQKSMTAVKCSVERWEAFEQTFTELQESDDLKTLKEEIKLQYTYPRLDVHVTRSLDHLLKTPFCVHPKTEKICIPFEAEKVDDFDLEKVPTLSKVIEELKTYDEREDTLPLGLNDYQKTSLTQHIELLERFVNNLEKDDKMKY
ncbi:unnamed protein product [Ceutorhynchus assimilis]|uniref:DNA primase n=1 Tax=Ceutorhynchus assimilis TaxID=467358 RepID=A0A9N9QEI6_9CUCU|nr:unnamed protein product [Ceutorhynchus assimilis]